MIAVNTWKALASLKRGCLAEKFSYPLVEKEISDEDYGHIFNVCNKSDM